MTDRPSAPDRLLAEFPVPAGDAWRAEAERLLKGVPFAKALVTRTLEGLELVPMATAADTSGLPWLDAAPGQAPYQRGTGTGAWRVAQELPLPSAAEVADALAHDLARGLEAAHLVLDAAGRRGLDPDAAAAADVGAGGTSLATVDDLAAALAPVDLALTPVQMQAGGAGLPAVALLLAAARRKGTAPAALAGAVGGDPLAQWAADGTLPRPLGQLRAEQALLVRWAAEHASGLAVLAAVEDPWHDGGADAVQSLALVLASAVATLRDLEGEGVDPGMAVAALRFQVCVGSGFFPELARIRALRLLWTRVQEAAGLVPRPARIHARTSRRTQTVHDAHVNMLRATTQALCAVLAGVDSLHVAPFDEMDSLPDAFSRRIARNVQLLLRHETRADAVADPAGGAWFVESLTADLARAAWARFQEIEARGGLAAALAAGVPQRWAADTAAERTARLATGRDVLVGTSRYADPAEAPRPIRTVPTGFAAGRAAAVKAARRGVTVPANASFDALIDAAAAGATLGQLSAALAVGLPPAGGIVPIPPRRDAAPFEALRARVAALRATDPARGRVACACLGGLARTLPRLDFTRGFFGVAGFEVIEGSFADTAAEAARNAMAAGAATVVAVALDDVYAAAGADLLAALKHAPGVRRVMVAGQPQDQVAALTAAGADGFIHLRSDLLAVLGDLVTHLEETR